MKKTTMGIITVLLAAGLAGGLQAQEITGEKGDFKLSLKKTFKAGAGGNLIIRGVNGDIKVTTAKTSEITIREEMELDVYTRSEAEENLNRIQGAYRQEGNTVTVEGGVIRQADDRRFLVVVPEKFNLDLSTMGGDLDIAGLDGNLKLRTLGGDVKVENVAGIAEVSTAGGDLNFKSISGQLRANTSGGDIEMEEILGECSASTQGGDIEVMHATNRLSISSSGGDIAMQKIEGALDARTMGGDLDLTGFSGAQASLETMGGEISLTGCSGPVRVNSQGGEISGQDISGALDITNMGGEILLSELTASANVVTMGGDVIIDLTLKDFKKPHALMIESKGGDVEVTLPASLPASILAEIKLSRKDWSNKRYDIYSDFPLSKESTDETDRRILRSKGEINGGGDPIKIITTGGDISIKKSQ